MNACVTRAWRVSGGYTKCHLRQADMEDNHKDGRRARRHGDAKIGYYVTEAFKTSEAVSDLASFARNRDHVYQNNTNSEPSRNLRSNWEGISVNVFSYSFFGHDLCHGLAIPYGRKFISIYQPLYIGFDTCR